MKWGKYNVELINEYAKVATWEKRHNVLDDQLYILAKQNRMMERLRGQVEYVITDSPLLLTLIYGKNYFPSSFQSFVKDLYSSYDNLNIFLTRKKDYIAIGRNQTEDEARAIDAEAHSLLVENNVPFFTVDADQEASETILKWLTGDNQ